jgi:hypothetical protein
VARYLVEAYVPRARARQVGASVGLVLEAARALTREGSAVRVIRTTSIPDDDTCFYVVEADSLEVVRELCVHAGLHSARVVEAFELPSDH